ncbi:SDR family NAD(P)-dependent oxidoreductase [Cytobacillus solani]|uniref:Short-chain dehydrogenase n=1 Tax=Cytobacillus solani TaxID=1637975 RepID=A0A0Q3QKM5_9BACI|nr:SDR family oxidoreductase [Cytobacillus solani]KOP70916.1 short-chain dehydrogenase [Bacillus sp. FJAT-21945]KQL18136.1 short-chain dehydrogenase [Cytobacillus solani]USK55974.1 SDR family oxidoreductase [Cytobacillus solani]
MKSIIITGAGSGLGKELAIRYSRQGYHLLLIGRTFEKLKEVEEQIQAENGHADSFAVDISSPSEIQAFISQAAKQFTIYGLINNAGIGHFGPFEQMPHAEIEEMLHVNVLGTIYISQAVLPYLVEKNEGLVMNIISTAGLRGKINESGYAASKFAVRGFTESLQIEYGHTGIMIKAVYMGGMDTPFWDHNHFIKDKSRLRSPAEIADKILANIEKDAIIIESEK